MKLFDLHCDTIGECYMQNQRLYDNSLSVSLKKVAGYEKYSQVFAIWTDDKLDEKQSLAYFSNVLRTFDGELEANSALISPVEHWGDLDRIGSNAVLSLENGKLIDGDLNRIDALYDCGVRMITLTWNGINSIGCGALSGDERGLTAFGRCAVVRMQERGIAVDVSHLNERGFYDVAAIAQRPFIASHSNAKSVCGHPRNLTDDQIKIIGESGGIIGLNLYHSFLGDGDQLRLACEHAARIIACSSENTLALGCDYDGADIAPVFDSVDKLEVLYQAFLDYGFGEPLCRKIFYENAYNYFTKNIYCGIITSRR